MSKDKHEDIGEFTFLKEQILPKKNKTRKILMAIIGTIILAIIFGIVARIIFIVSGPLANRLLGVDEQKKQVTLSSANHQMENGNGSSNAQSDVKDSTGNSATSEDDANRQEEVGNEQQTVPEDDGKDDSDSQTVNNTYYIEKKISATAEDLASMFSHVKVIANTASSSLVKVVSVESGVDWMENPYTVEAETSGIVVASDDENLYILTAYDDIKDSTTIRIELATSTSVEGEILNRDKATGMAIVTIPVSGLTKYTLEQVKIATLGDSYLLQKGTPIIGIGAPNGVYNSIDFGMISNSDGVSYLTDLKLDMLYTNLSLSDVSRGFIVNLDGEVVGIISQGYLGTEDKEEGFNLDGNTFIGITRIKRLIEKLINKEEQVYFGIIGEDMPVSALNEAEISNGIYVSEVEAKSPAYDAGILSGDIIIAIDDNAVGGMNSFVSIIDGYNVKSKLKVKVKRFTNGVGTDYELELILGKKDTN